MRLTKWKALFAAVALSAASAILPGVARAAVAPR